MRVGADEDGTKLIESLVIVEYLIGKYGKQGGGQGVTGSPSQASEALTADACSLLPQDPLSLAKVKPRGELRLSAHTPMLSLSVVTPQSPFPTNCLAFAALKSASLKNGPGGGGVLAPCLPLPNPF